MKLQNIFANKSPGGARCRMAALAAGLLLIPVLAVNSQTSAVTFQSSGKQTSLVELFTSEGCSSCPPAEAWLSRQKDAAGLWKDFVPVAFHVDYWDHLGWRDPWASKEFSDRQQNYAQVWGNGSIYTPGFVCDGREWRGWSGRRDVPRSEAKAGVLTVSSTNHVRWQVSFSPAMSGERYEVRAALLASGLSSDVKAGENSGRRLNHDFVAVSLVKVPLKKQGAAFEGECVLTPDWKTGGRLALAVWVVKAGQPESVQAVGGWLPPPK